MDLMYTVKLTQFEGPLDFLLQLVEEEKLDITEISLAKVTDQYIKYLGEIKEVPLEGLADFLVIASRLLLIKSRLLLPTLEISEEEEKDIEELKKQLREYKKFRLLAEKLKEMAENNTISWSREKYQEIKPIFYFSRNITLENLRNRLEELLKEIALLGEQLPQKEIKSRISLEEKIKEIQERLAEKIEITFASLTTNSKFRTEIILSFLALLESIKQQLVLAKQDKVFGEIRIAKTKS